MGRTALIPFSVRVSVPGDLKILIGSKAPLTPTPLKEYLFGHVSSKHEKFPTLSLALREILYPFISGLQTSESLGTFLLCPDNCLWRWHVPFNCLATSLGHENRKLSQSSNDYIVRQLKISSCIVLHRNVGAKLQGRLCRTRPSWSASHMSWREMERALPRAARMERNASWREVGRRHCSFTVWENSSLPLASLLSFDL